MKIGIDAKCRLCRQSNEFIQDVVSICRPILNKTAYSNRHKTIAKQTGIYWNICQAYGIEVVERWYHTQDPLIDTSENGVIKIQTDRQIIAYKPIIIIEDKTQNTGVLIGIAIPSNYNITQKKNRETPTIQRSCNRNTTDVEFKN